MEIDHATLAAERSDDELRAMVHAPDQWTPDALMAARAELDRRGVDVAESESSGAPAAVDESFGRRHGLGIAAACCMFFLALSTAWSSGLSMQFGLFVILGFGALAYSFRQRPPH